MILRQEAGGGEEKSDENDRPQEDLPPSPRRVSNWLALQSPLDCYSNRVRGVALVCSRRKSFNVVASLRAVWRDDDDVNCARG